MATITGTNLSAQLVPFDSQNTYPTHDSQYGRGGWLEAETVAGRNAIPSDRLRNGSVCYVEETELPYQYKDGVWNVLFTGRDPLEGLGRYTQISYTGTQVNVSAQDTPYAKVKLVAREGNPVQYLNVYGAASGTRGKVMVFQTGDITLELGTTAINGEGGVPLQGTITPFFGFGSIFLVEWEAVAANAIRNESILLLAEDRPKEITVFSDLQDYYGAKEATLKWSAPAGCQKEKVDEYDLRYSETPVNFKGADGKWKSDAEVEAIWLSMNRVVAPDPSKVKTMEYYGAKNLSPAVDYYFAIRGISEIDGIAHASYPSIFPHFRTKAYNEEVSYLELSPDNLYPRMETSAFLEGLESAAEKKIPHHKNMIDEQGKVLRKHANASEIALERPSSFAPFYNYWRINPFGKGTTPFNYIIDLYAPHVIDSLFIATASDSVSFNVYTLSELTYGADWSSEAIKVQTPQTGSFGNQQWTKIPFGGRTCRFIRFSFECLEYPRYISEKKMVRFYKNVDGEYLDSTQDGQKGFTTSGSDTNNDTVPKILEIIAYGKPVNADFPTGIRPPVRRVLDKPTVDEFISANDQGFHQGRLSGLYADPAIRQYMSHTDHSILGQNGNKKKYVLNWNQPGEAKFSQEDIRATRFRLTKIDWVTTYSGLRDTNGKKNAEWRDSLQRTYAKRGLKPFCTATGPLAQTAIYYSDWENNFIQHRYMDKYFTDNYNSMPYPVVGGVTTKRWIDYFKETENPQNYKLVSKLAFCIAKKYGKVTETDVQKRKGYLWEDTDPSKAEETSTGNDLLCGMEFFNEPDNLWKGFGAYMQPLEFAAVQSAVYDGHCGALAGNHTNWYGIKTADPDFLSIAPGFITLHPGYLLEAYIWWVTHRNTGNRYDTIPLDVLNTHAYFSCGGNQDLSVSTPNLMGCSVEYTLKNNLNPSLELLPRMRDIYMPDKPIWITELAWGEFGSFIDPYGERRSIFQARSLEKGKYDNITYTSGTPEARYIPARFRADIKGQNFVRAVISLMDLGYDKCHWFMTENEINWFSDVLIKGGDYFNRSLDVSIFNWTQVLDNAEKEKDKKVIGVLDENGNELVERRFKNGFEMFYWGKGTDPDAPTGAGLPPGKIPFRPGASKFAGCGLFGNTISNGAYPISRAFWYIKTFRDRFSGYVFGGYIPLRGGVNYDRIIVAYFYMKSNPKKAAYVVYYQNPDECSTDSTLLNCGVADVNIPLFSRATEVTHVKTYVPEIGNPREMPLFIKNPNCTKCPNKPKDNSTCPALDVVQIAGENRTVCSYVSYTRNATPTSRYERWNGTEWEITNARDWDYTNHKYIDYAYTPRKSTDQYPQNPKTGDEVTFLPTETENPYFPLVGPVGAVTVDKIKVYYSDKNVFEEVSRTFTANEHLKGTSPGFESTLSWRQVDAVCDYIELTEEGRHGCRGDQNTIAALSGKITVNVTEEPEYYFFENERGYVDVVSGPDSFNIEDVRAVALSPSSARVWWNNMKREDVAYQVFFSKHSETDYIPYNRYVTEGAGMENNSMLIEGLEEDTQYFFKVHPYYSGGVTGAGKMSPVATVRTWRIPLPDLYISARSQNSITLKIKWKGDRSLFSEYRIFCTNDTGEYVQVGTISDVGLENSTEKCYEQSYIATGLTAGKTYSYKARAVQSDGQSKLTEAVSIKTLTSGQQADSLTLNSITLGDGTGKVFRKFIEVKFTYTASTTPKYYLLSEDPAFGDAEWKEFTGNPVDFTVSNGHGSKILYAKMRLDRNYMESASKNNLATLLNGAVVALGFETWNNTSYPEEFIADYGIQTIALNQLQAKTIKNNIGNDFGTIISLNTPIGYGDGYAGNIPGNNVLKLHYPDSVFIRNSVCRRDTAPGSFKDSSAGMIKITLNESGKYRVRLFGTTKDNEISSKIDQYSVAITDELSDLDANRKNYENGTIWKTNFTKQLIWDNIQLNSDKTIYVGWYNSSSSKNAPLNTIEIEKTS